MNYIKYPRTFHLPWSEGVTSDDKVLKSIDHFKNKRVIVTEKMDGENTTMYQNYIHARSIDSRHHESRNWVKAFHASICHNIPEDWRVCGENLYAKHSIKYDNLKSYFYAFSIWDANNKCLSWDDFIVWCDTLEIVPVTVLYDGIFDEDTIRSLYSENDLDNHEGYVVRLGESFHYDDFQNSVAKFVRRNHVQTDEHWTKQVIEPNVLI